MRDFLNIVETAYQPRSTPHEWLGSIAAAARPFLDQGDGMFACESEVTGNGDVFFQSPVLLDCSSVIWELAQQSAVRLTPEERQENLRHPATFATVSERLGRGGHFADHWMYAAYQRVALADFSLLTAADVDGHGLVLGSPRRRLTTTPSKERKRWALVAAHLRAASRLARAGSSSGGLDDPSIDAVFTPAGAPAHLQRAALNPRSRTALREAVMSMDAARSARGRREPEKALSIWKSLVRGRWTLVDCFDSDGKRFLVARQNAPVPSSIASLTRRESQVVAYLALGHSNKFVAYELGLSPSFVSELLLSAMLKLGVKSRLELVQRMSSPRPRRDA